MSTNTKICTTPSKPTKSTVIRRGARFYKYQKIRVGKLVKSIYKGVATRQEFERQRFELDRYIEKKKIWQALELIQAKRHLLMKYLMLRSGFHKPNYGPWRKRQPSKLNEVYKSGPRLEFPLITKNWSENPNQITMLRLKLA